MRDQKPNKRGVLIVWALFNVIMAPLEYYRRAMDRIRGRDHFRPEYLIPLVELACLSRAVGLPRGVLLLLTMQCVLNTLLVIISTPVHRSAYAWTSGCEDVVPAAADFGVQTVISTNDFCVDEAGLFDKIFFFASFNDHVTHHLFPTVDLSKQHVIRPIFLSLCRKFNVPYRKTHFFDLFCSVFQVLLRKPEQLLYYPG